MVDVKGADLNLKSDNIVKVPSLSINKKNKEDSISSSSSS